MRIMRHAKGIIITRAIICCYIAVSVTERKTLLHTQTNYTKPLKKYSCGRGVKY